MAQLHSLADTHAPHRNQVASDATLHEPGGALKTTDMIQLSSCKQIIDTASIEVCLSDAATTPLGFKANQEPKSDNAGGHAHYSKANSSFMHSTINVVGIMIGLGQLSTPYALEKGGWMSGFLLVGLGVVCGYTANAMGKCLGSSSGVKNYQDLGERAFGRVGRIMVSTFLYLEIFLALVSYTISLGDNLNTIFSSHANHLSLSFSWMHLSPQRFITVIAVVMALPSLWLRDLSSISFLSSGGIVMSLLLVFTVAWTAAFGGVGVSRRLPALNMSNVPHISGLYVFSYGGHVVFPNIYKAMKDPSQFSKVVAVSFCMITVVYTGLGFMGATMFGSDIKSQITLNMPKEVVVTKIALWASVITPMTKYALELSPVAMQMESVLPKWMGSKSRMVVRATISSILLIIILAMALTLPYFSYILALTGSLLSTCISIVFPCAFYIKICRSTVTRPGLALNIAFITLGIFLGVVGTISSVRSLVKSVSDSRATQFMG